MTKAKTKTEIIADLPTIYPSQVLLRLTPHEYRIFDLAIEGLSYAQMSRLVGVSMASGKVNNCLCRIRKKLGFSSTPEMVAAYWRSQAEILNAEIALLKAQNEIQTPDQPEHSP